MMGDLQGTRGFSFPYDCPAACGSQTGAMAEQIQPPVPPAAPAVDMRGITVRCSSTLANDRIDFRVERGTVHALVGENGAGKTTLMKVLYGQRQPDSGTIHVDGTPRRFRSPADAIAAGIGMVHQHFMLVPPFTVAENVILGNEPTRLGVLDLRRATAEVAELAERFGMTLDPAARVADLGVGEQQRVEILKVLHRRARILILDEPTAVLTPDEVDELFATVRGLRDTGHTVVIITHKLREVMALADRLTVLRLGRVVGGCATAETTPAEITRMMVGRDVLAAPLLRGAAGLDDSVAAAAAPPDDAPPPAPDDSPAAPRTPAMRVTGLCADAAGTGMPLRDVDLELFPGEVLGVAGVAGNGQTELVEVLMGLRRATAGRVELGGRDATHFTPARRLAHGLACVPEDRQRSGLVLDFSLRDNLMLGRHREPAASVRFSRARARELLRRFDVRPPDPNLPARMLSGGNQQKLIAAREFTRDAAVLLAAHPTRGVDLAAVAFLHGRLLDLRDAGTAILLISSELSEILSLSDRVAVMFGGRIVFLSPNTGLTEQELGAHMAGAAPSMEEGVGG